MRLLERESESELVQRLYARDETAMDFFYKNYRQALYHTIWRIVRHHQQAEDLLQESMVRFWTAFPSYDTSKGRLFTWALNISRNLALDHLRQRRRIAEHTDPLSDNLSLHLVAPATFNPEHVGVRDWLALLSASDRTLLDILYVKGYTHVEAAAALAIPLGTVKSRARRIIRSLAAQLRSEAG